MGWNKYDESRNPSGRPPKWALGRTRTIRVPVAIADQVLEYARELDKKGSSILTQNLEASKYIG